MHNEPNSHDVKPTTQELRGSPASPRDQAWLLRQLADQQQSSNVATAGSSEQKSSNPKSSKPSPTAPHVAMICELPTTQGCCELSLRIALHSVKLGTEGDSRSTLLADLSPAASRLIATCDSHPDLKSLATKTQSLWHESAHGRTLTIRPTEPTGDLRIVAQPAGKLPTGDQLPRIYEQLIRHLGLTGRLDNDTQLGCYRNVIFLTQPSGLPHDMVCWGVADAIAIFYDESTHDDELKTLLASRLSQPHPEQRVLLIRKNPPRLRDWAGRLRLEPTAVPAYALDLERVEHFQLSWPYAQSRLRKSLASVASILAEQLFERIPTRAIKQAS